jgi:hypothetical protein
MQHSNQQQATPNVKVPKGQESPLLALLVPPPRAELAALGGEGGKGDVPANVPSTFEYF